MTAADPKPSVRRDPTECEADGLGFLPWAPIAMGDELTAW
jgi:hypothetical protein